MNSFDEQFWASFLTYKDSDNIAFCINDKCYTYAQLYDTVIRLSRRICLIPEQVVYLYAIDDIITYASILSLWFCGKAYVPLNPTQPKERHMQIVSDVKAGYLLCAVDDYELEGVEIIRTNHWDLSDDGPVIHLDPISVSDDSLAYILFTSGSTGKPKGVKISRGNLAGFIESMKNIGLDICTEDRCLQPFDLTFDFSVSAYLIPLVCGASIYTIPNRAVKFTYIAALLEKYGLTILQMVPSMIRNLLPYLDEVELESVRYNILCGEALKKDIIKKWHGANDKMITYNMYGPTEDTVFCTYYHVSKSNIESLLADNDVVCIGRSFMNSSYILIDENNQIINEFNKTGELCLAGSQLTPGYWHNDEENQIKFFVYDNVRYYKTGDLCYLHMSNELIYVNRKDFQVKINGFRVELGEIESRFCRISGGREAIVLPYENAQGNIELAIIIEGKAYDYSDHRDSLSKELPAYEIPMKWLFIDTFPLNKNGKIDRKRIKKKYNL